MRIAAIPLLLALAGTSLPARAQEVPLWTGLTAKGGNAILTKPVRSWKALKFDGMVRQETDFSCGAAALATILRYGYGKAASERQILVNMMKIADPAVVKEKGFSLLDMKRYVGSVGMTGQGYEVPYAALKDLRVPGIALLNIRGYKHFVVIRKVGDEHVQIADPALGNRVMTRTAFEKAWNGVVFAVLGEGFDPNSALKNPPPPLSARRLYDQRSPIQNAEASDFGIQQSTSFTFF